MTVFRAFRFLPLAFITEAVSKSLRYRIECQPQKSQVTSGEVRRTGRNTASQFFQQNRDDERASIVVPRIEVRTFPHGVARGPIVQQLDRLFGNRLWVVEGNKHAALVVQQLDRVQVWSGDDRFSRAQGIGKRS